MESLIIGNQTADTIIRYDVIIATNMDIKADFAA